MKLEKKICKKTRCQPALTFKTHNPNHYIVNSISKKTHEVQFLTNQMLKDGIKKKLNYIEGSKIKKIAIKKIMIKIKIKNKLEDNYRLFFIEGLN